jgi:putative DNA primase/helicase
VTAECLLQAVSSIASITLLALHWPKKGSRHAAALALAGTLLRGGFGVAEAEAIIEYVCDAAGDEEVKDRITTVASTASRIASGGAATGAPTLSSLFEPKIVAALFQWLGLKREAAALDQPDYPTDWDTPILFDQIKTPDIPATLLPGVFGVFAKALADTAEIPEAMAVMTTLGAISAAVATRFEVAPLSGWAEPVNIYAMVVLPPANNKSLVIRNCMQPIDRWEFNKRLGLEPAICDARSERKNQESQIQSKRGKAAKETDLIKQRQLFSEVKALEANLTVVPVPPQIYLNDVTAESLATAVCEQSGRIALISDEGGIMETMGGLYSSGHANYDILLKGIDGGRVRLKRKERDLDINPILTIVLVVQPQILRNMSDRKALQGRGLVERFLFVLPQSHLGYRTLKGDPIPKHIARSYQDALQNLLDLQPQADDGIEQPRRLVLTEDALAAWQLFRHEVEAMLRPDGKLSSCPGWGGKIVGFSLRLAALMHVAGYGVSELKISLDTMQNAIAMARLLIEHALAAFGQMQDDQATEDAKAVLAWIRHTGGAQFRRSDCLRKFHGRFTSKKRLDAALSVLTDRSIIGPPRIETTTTGKRGTVFHGINPQLVDQKN